MNLLCFLPRLAIPRRMPPLPWTRHSPICMVADTGSKAMWGKGLRSCCTLLCTAIRGVHISLWLLENHVLLWCQNCITLHMQQCKWSNRPILASGFKTLLELLFSSKKILLGGRVVFQGVWTFGRFIAMWFIGAWSFQRWLCWGQILTLEAWMPTLEC